MKAKLLQDCSEGNKGEIVDLDKRTFEILTREGFAEKAPEGSLEEKIPEIEPEDESEGDDEWSDIEQELETEQSWPPQWKPEEDGQPEKLLGKVVDTGETQYGPAVVVRDRGGTEWTVFSGRKALEDFLDRAEIGHRVGLKYLGQVTPEGGGNKYHNYRTVVKEG